MCQSDTYIIHSKMKSYQNKVKQAKEIIEAALKGSNNSSLSFSSGKDSVVLLDLAVKAGFKGKLVFFKYGIISDIETPKENIELLKYYAEKHGLEYIILDCLGEVDCWSKCGKFILFPETEEEKKIFKQTNYDYVKKSAEFEEKNNIDLSIIGMRKDESKHRKIILSKKGAVYQTKSRKSLTCCPLLNFSNRDIWAYIFENGLKYLSIYDYPNMDRDVIRNEITLLYNDSLIRNGMIWHYKQMYPDFFLWLKDEYGGTLI